MRVIIVLFIALIMSGCYTKLIDSTSSEDESFIMPEGYISPSSIDIETDEQLSFLLIGWKRSFEEEKDSVKIYRPGASREFPMSRFRETVEFYKDGKLKYLYLSPNDAHYFKYGTWVLSKEDRNIIGLIYTPPKINRIKIIQLNADILSFVSLD